MDAAMAAADDYISNIQRLNNTIPTIADPESRQAMHVKWLAMKELRKIRIRECTAFRARYGKHLSDEHLRLLDDAIKM
jgi:hypothetical protein